MELFLQLITHTHFTSSFHICTGSLQVISERLFSTPRSSTSSSLNGNEEGDELREPELQHHGHGEDVISKRHIERFPIECHKTKLITLVNHNRRKQDNEPIRIGRKYM